MNSVLDSMMSKYPEATSDAEAKNAVKQALQEITLCGLGRSDFYQNAAFNGGSALRIFHGLQRFSEDLDFSIDNEKIDTFVLDKYVGCINNELASLGIPATFEVDSKSGFIQRGYIKGNCREILNCFGTEEVFTGRVPANEVLKIKLEADAAALSAASYETKYLLQPYPTPVRLYDKCTLFAGKVSAVLSRSWKSRVKGRDLYDYLFYITNKYPMNLAHLESRLKNNGYLKSYQSLDKDILKQLLCERFTTIDYASAKSDVSPFIRDRKVVDFWSADLFIAVTKDFDF
ncbi:MAG TPA: nucleotidyl transferase AbiEii/AbiGii toxin family protein [Clostridia bacterium]|jgi:predicted nucleotidyltransferase component of viral defense system|nr:nucleotidyl transferase AbiEii/AbiGii toxin family protein [Clostridia bacterium]HOM34372.1 nucleotidyl transferase AbiEii/AbiGii toxin family protein [Clostridia bacterium]HOR89322.1 nucleotidyl transferase AbiEii/AbiGii toxin family protein [Clostridia bacterium]HOT70562.1 nucleotidyl transferase AbiEii/AbiGii toxin family protein [Clostridia bacterium]HPL08224.1 nucleotidyl transferase AbiEii/AbiGii toxin family protein [Clostridia bacterium]